ncbi:MAG: hypothetical protein ACI9RU_002923 [Litorivivens sp.]
MKEEFDIFNIYDGLERNNVMLLFKGELTPDLINSILHIVEEKITRSDTNLKIRKKVFNILVECLQNLYHHNQIRNSDMDSATEFPAGMIMVAEDDEGFSVMTGNFIAKEIVSTLQKKLEQINNLDREGLKELYSKVLGNGEMTAKGGGSLGLIEIARKSGEKLEYGFAPLDNMNNFFSLNVKVNY